MGRKGTATAIERTKPNIKKWVVGVRDGEKGTIKEMTFSGIEIRNEDLALEIYDAEGDLSGSIKEWIYFFEV